MSTPIVPSMRRCTKCGEEKPATTEYFQKHSRDKSGLQCWCKECSRAYYQENHERIKQRTHDYYHSNREKGLETRRAYYRANRDAARARSQVYVQNNKERLTEARRRWAEKNKESIANRIRVWRELNREEVARKDKLKRIVNPYPYAVAGHNRRARERELPATFTARQWDLCLKYWSNACAVCGYPFNDVFGVAKKSADHWIAVSQPNCPGTVAENMVCLCGRCNSSKQDKMPIDWLIQRYSERKAKQILRRIQDYFQWIVQQ
jgi:hypothetical protein